MREHINGRLTHGDIRDGKVFWGFNCGVEEWCTPEAFERRKEKKNRRSVWLAGRRRHWLGKYKEAQSCQTCFEKYGVWFRYKAKQLAFHHTHDWEKEFTVANKIKGPLKELMHEVSKCEVKCHNCHALEH